MLRPTISRPVCLGIKHTSGAYDQIFITFRQLRICWCGALSLRVDGSVIYNYCWPSTAQSFFGPSHIALLTILYCLRFEASLFVASYYSQGYGGGIRPRLHTGECLELTNELLLYLRLQGFHYCSSWMCCLGNVNAIPYLNDRLCVCVYMFAACWYPWTCLFITRSHCLCPRVLTPQKRVC
jgi:hypothetical protein